MRRRGVRATPSSLLRRGLQFGENVAISTGTARCNKRQCAWICFWFTI
jgi:hypothetical protein